MFGSTFGTCRYVWDEILVPGLMLNHWKVELYDGAWRANPTGCVALNEETTGAAYRLPRHVAQNVCLESWDDLWSELLFSCHVTFFNKTTSLTIWRMVPFLLKTPCNYGFSLLISTLTSGRLYLDESRMRHRVPGGLGVSKVWIVDGSLVDFHPTWGHDPIWRAYFFEWVETTNYIHIYSCIFWCKFWKFPFSTGTGCGEHPKIHTVGAD